MLRALVSALAVVCLSCAGQTGPQGPAGPEGPEGQKGDPGDDFMAMRSISAVSPTRVAVGLTTDVTLIGYATNWTSAAQVSFGQGVTVNSVRVGSATGIVANITVAADAMPGTRDVVVTQGTTMTTFSGIFTLAPYFDIKSFGMATRGGGIRFEVRSNDPDFSFPAATAVTATVAPVPAAGRLTTSVTADSPRALSVTVAANFLATLGMYAVTLSFSGRTLVLPSFELVDKVELPLADGTPITAITLEPNEKKLIKVTGPAAPVDTLVHISMGTAAATNVRLVLLDTAGEPVDILYSAGRPAPGNDLVLNALDSTGLILRLEETSGARAMNVSVTALTSSVAELEPNDDAMTAQVLTLGAFGTEQGVHVLANSASSSDLDFYKFTVAQGDVGKRIHVRTWSLAYIWYDTPILGPSGATFTTSNIDNKTTDYYSPVITEPGDYTISLDPDTSGGYHFSVSIQ